MPVLYHKSLSEFREDISRQRIADEIKSAGYTDEVGQTPSAEEEDSWQNSLGALCRALNGLDGAYEVYIEYVLPPASLLRTDFMITGINADGRHAAVIIELKQWSGDSIFIREGQPDYTLHAKWDDTDKDHPSHQACRYAHTLKSQCTSVRGGMIIISTCVFLHNFDRTAGVVTDVRFDSATKRAPIFFKDEEEKLAEFISKRLSAPDSGSTVKMLEDPKNHILDPRLIDTITATLSGGSSFGLTTRQWEIFSELKEAHIAGSKTVVIITGAPGTGKTVLALRLMGEFRRRGSRVRYVTLSQNLRYLFIDKLCSDNEKMKAAEGIILTTEEKDQFKLDAEQMITPPYFTQGMLFREISITDEAHRLTRMENDRYNPFHFDNRAEYLIENSELSIFLIDDDQQVRWEDYVTTETIELYCSRKGYVLIKRHLEDGIRQYTPYINWITALFSPLPIPLKMNPGRYLVKVYDKASDMYSEILRLNGGGHPSRILAGYCWRWRTRGRNKASIRAADRDIQITDRSGRPDLQLMWNQVLNRNDYGGTWIGRSDSVDEVGCIHTAQGIDMEYVGVIIGKDIRYNRAAGRIEFHVEEHPSDDFSVTVNKDTNEKVDPTNAERLIRNAYRVLMTRSTKGCLIYCEDEALSQYIKALLI